MERIRLAFQKMNKIDPSPELKRRILLKIEEANARISRLKYIYYFSTLGISIGAFIAALMAYGRAFFESDFWNLAKLAYSDSGVIATHLSEFSISLLETLPVLEMAAMLLPVFALALLMGYSSRIFDRNNFNHIR